MVVYTGDIELNPATDSWVRTIQLPDRSVNITQNRSRTITQNLRSTIDLNFGTTNLNIRTNRRTRGNTRGRLISRTVSDRVLGSARASASSDTTNTSVNVDTISFDDVNTRNELQRASDEVFMRSRNTEFKVSNLKPSTRFYQFIDGNSGVDFIPKLIEIANSTSLANYGTSSGSFQIGETVIG